MHCHMLSAARSATHRSYRNRCCGGLPPRATAPRAAGAASASTSVSRRCVSKAWAVACSRRSGRPRQVSRSGRRRSSSGRGITPQGTLTRICSCVSRPAATRPLPQRVRLLLRQAAAGVPCGAHMLVDEVPSPSCRLTMAIAPRLIAALRAAQSPAPCCVWPAGRRRADANSTSRASGA